ncbi:MAG: molybdopterin molybdenumtransferase MoeA [Gloeocapsa sp. DLM2.Bin57]|nr:MAG: molybdopterin molybdenumtransferase MoeA [Gloeocapsa sp. DLM2.Bin57]
MISVNQAETIILDLIQPVTDTETVDLHNAVTRILATAIKSDLDFPYWDNSAMDGYAVRYEDVTNPPLNLTIVAEIPAGKVPQKTISQGEAARIYTGGMLPPGADTIIMQEYTQRQGDRLVILKAPKAPQAFVRKKGEYYQPGNPLLKEGITLSAAEIAVLATIQVIDIPVKRRPKVAILSTGDELVNPSQPLQPGKIIDSNQYALYAFVLSQGAIPIPLGIVPDNPEELRDKISQAIEVADIVLSTGGVSVGSYDYVEQILKELGAKIAISSVAVKPGKPLTVAKFPQGCVYFGIPGNPVSALVSCWRFVQPAIAKLSGKQQPWIPQWLAAENLQTLKSTSDRETYVWGRLNIHQGVYQFKLASGSQNSGNLINLAQTNAIAVIPRGNNTIVEGDKIMTLITK